MRAVLLAAALTLSAHGHGSATAGDGADWRPVILQIETVAGTAACALGIAHWYEHMSEPVSAGSTLEIGMFVRPATGEVGLQNDVGRKMLLETIHCGDASLSRETWRHLAIDVLRAAHATSTIRCGGTPLSCRWDG